MPDLLHAALFPESLSTAERDEARRALAEDADARRLYEYVSALQDAVATAFDDTTPDRDVLVLSALVEAGHADALTPDEQARLREMKEADASLHPALGDIRRAMAMDIRAFEQAWQEEPRSVPALPKRKDRVPQGRAAKPRWAWRVGVGLAVAAFAAVSVLLVQRDASYVTVEVAQGATQTLTLADGSTVKLLGGARLTYSDPDAAAVFNRQVTLAGDAFFDVQPGSQSFVVRAGNAEVRVLGTTFGVRAQPAETEVTLVEGKVLFSPAGAPTRGVTLAPGEQSRLTGDAPVPTPPTAVEPNAALVWAGLFFFDNTPMRDVAAELSRGFRVTIEVSPALADERVTGTFDSVQGAGQIVKALAETLGAKATRTDTGWKVGE